MKRLCPPLYFDCSPTSGSKEITCTAHRRSDDTEVGHIIASPDHADETLARVGIVKVSRGDLLRCGIGTKLYEHVAAEACKRGMRLASDTHRTRFSEKFWKKQVTKGRAVCISRKSKTKRGGSMLDDYMDPTDRQWSCRQYAMKECAAGPIDLSGTTKRIKWRGEPVVKKKRRR